MSFDLCPQCVSILKVVDEVDGGDDDCDDHGVGDGDDDDHGFDDDS